MNRIRYIIQLLVVVTLFGCTDEEWMKHQGEIEVSAGFANTRTTFVEDNGTTRVTWNKGDAIGLMTKDQKNLKYVAQSDGKETLFAATEDKLKAQEGETVHAYYPYNSLDGNNRVKLPNMGGQEYSENGADYDFIYASAQVENGKLAFQFKHLFAFLKIKLPLELVADRGERGGLSIYSTEPIATNEYFDLAKEEFSEVGYRNLYYYIPTDEKLGGKKEVTCYIAILPQTENAVISIYTQKDGNAVKFVLSRYAPSGGFKAGNVYTVRLNETDSEIEREALIAFYKATNGDKWLRNDNWCSDKPLSEWYGVQMEHERVRVLNFINNNISGVIPEEIGDLRDLTHLIIVTEYPYTPSTPNMLKGPLPESIGNLTKLQQLMLFNQLIEGPLPENMRNLKSLHSLDISGGTDSSGEKLRDFNYPTGEIPAWIAELPNLTGLNLAYNNFTGGIPAFLANNPNLELLTLSDNLLSGPLPDFWDRLPKLYGLFLSNNNFTGTLPPTFVKLLDYKKLECILIDGNKLTGKFSDALMNHPKFPYFVGLLVRDQQPGYGFDFSGMDIPASKHTYQLMDSNEMFNLAEEYSKHEYTIFLRWGEEYADYDWMIPIVNEIRKNYPDKELKVVGLYAGSNTPERKTYMKEAGIDDWTHILEFGDDYIYQRYVDLNGYMDWKMWYNDQGVIIPFTEVVDRKGNVVFVDKCRNIYGVSPYSGLSIARDQGELPAFFQNVWGGGTGLYESTDYSKDGEVLVLQKATKGKGIDLVFMGDGFVDTDMESGGKYEEMMKAAMEEFFSIEPYKSFRDRFNIYAVKVVSPNAEMFVPGARRAIAEDDNVAFGYAAKVPNIDKERMMVSVIYNTTSSAGRSYTVMYGDGSFVGYMMEGVNEVLIHEVGGHGFAKLLDEYIEGGNENLSLPDMEKDRLDMYATWEWGWGANVDYHGTETDIKWAHMLKDNRYMNEVGIYEGSFLYGYGAYRSSYNSMMRYNIRWFNAPSREGIYKAIMTMSDGKEWQYNYEEFAAYDAINRGTMPETRAISEADRKKWQENHRPPVIKQGSWHDAPEKKGGSTIIIPLRR